MKVGQSFFQHPAKGMQSVSFIDPILGSYVLTVNPSLLQLRNEQNNHGRDWCGFLSLPKDD